MIVRCSSVPFLNDRNYDASMQCYADGIVNALSFILENFMSVICRKLPLHLSISLVILSTSGIFLFLSMLIAALISSTSILPSSWLFNNFSVSVCSLSLDSLTKYFSHFSSVTLFICTYSFTYFFLFYITSSISFVNIFPQGISVFDFYFRNSADYSISGDFVLVKNIYLKKHLLIKKTPL